MKVYIISSCDEWHSYASMRTIMVSSEENLTSNLQAIQRDYEYTDDDMEDYINVQQYTLDEI